MIKTALYIPPDMKEALRVIAFGQRVSMTELLRDAVEEKFKVKPEEVFWDGAVDGTHYQVGKFGGHSYFLRSTKQDRAVWPVNVDVGGYYISWHDALEPALEAAKQRLEADGQAELARLIKGGEKK